VFKSGFIILRVYDILGKEVSILVNEIQTAGEKTVFFNAGNLAGGIYFYELSIDGNSEFRKMIFLK
jgi:hypothetical protein